MSYESPSPSRTLLARRAAVVCPGVPLASTATVRCGLGARLEDLDGRPIIDLASGIGVVGAGHCPPRMVEAITRQAQALLHTCIHIATYEPYVALCERLVTLLPHGAHTKAMLVNSGAEAVENAVKIARQATGRAAVLCYGDAFHGRTLMSMTLTAKVGYKLGCGPFAPEVYRLPFPDRFHHGDGLTEEAFVARELARVRSAFSTMVAPTDLAAIIIEPVLGEGGFIPAPATYLAGLRRLCDAHGVMLIFDEVQTGFGRVGRLGAFQHYGVTPDLSTWAKAMSGGLPVAAVVGRAQVMDAARPGTLGGTYGGNPVACAAALANLDLIEELDLCARALKLGERVRERFLALQARCPVIADVRGLGAMMAMELCEGGDPTRPASALVKDVVKACLDRGVLLLSAGPHGNVIRILCPLVIELDDLDRGLSIIEQELLQRVA